MDMGTLRGIVTAVLLVLFVAVVVWAYSRARHEEFSAAARRPLDDDRAPPGAHRPAHPAGQAPEDTKQGHRL